MVWNVVQYVPSPTRWLTPKRIRPSRSALAVGEADGAEVAWTDRAVGAGLVAVACHAITVLTNAAVIVARVMLCGCRISTDPPVAFVGDRPASDWN
jgi:hypothetical protein